MSEDHEDEFDHFTDAQETVWTNVVAELRAGQKRSHWMWFVFPVLEGVGQSPTALFFALRDLDEARDYLAHPILGPRLLECIALVLEHRETSAEEMFGATDAFKLHNCATLFGRAASDPAPFQRVLDRFFAGVEAERSLYLLAKRSVT